MESDVQNVCQVASGRVHLSSEGRWRAACQSHLWLSNKEKQTYRSPEESQFSVSGVMVDAFNSGLRKQVELSEFGACLVCTVSSKFYM